MDRLTAIHVFTEVAARGSLTGAADALGMSRAMATRYLESLEAWLDARLLHRTTRRLSLTDAGTEALKYCQQVLELTNEMQITAGSRRVVPAGILRITCGISFAQARLSGLIADFLARYPKTQVELVALERAVNLVEDRIDLAIRISNQIDETLVSRPLGVCRSVICASPAYLACYGAPHSPDKLYQHRFVAHATVGRSEYCLRHNDHLVRIPVSAVFQSNETVLTRQAVLDGIGIGLLPTYFVEDDLASGRLIRLLPDYEPEPFGIYAVYLSRAHQPQLLRLMVDFLAERFSEESSLI